ncbi:hypothetical protein M5E87_08685 [Flavonifractor plautii]|nr:hypothetical protein M5E87_08685 [Flavonifractor plautii]
MNAPTIIIGLIILAVFVAIVGKGIYNRRHGKSSCSCGAPAAEGAATAPRPGCATLRSNRRHAGARLAPLSKE